MVPTVIAAAVSSPLTAQDLQTTVAADLGFVQQRIVSLAEAIPEAQYGWRPAEGVRSVGEVLIHVAAGNYVILQRIGADDDAVRDGVRLEDPGVVADPRDIVRAVEESFGFALDVIRATPDGELWEQAPRAGPGTTVASQLLLVQTHAHEHLGQLIAYARTLGVAPPWSR